MMKGWVVTLLCSWSVWANANTEVWIDVASKEEYAIEHLHNAIHIPHTHVARGVSTRYPDKNTVIKLYGRGQFRDQQASQALQALGYQAVSYLGALTELKASGLTTHTIEPASKAQPSAEAAQLSDTAALSFNTPNTQPH
ncbi:MAG: rhodanese-like domain-containing protein [Oceanisphaera sp.]|uniref:rhodanese-like domain-containing protein n=1 Tax=Oceanisphaera sp. TaxID=1929979 RepID=UPI003F970ACD